MKLILISSFLICDEDISSVNKSDGGYGAVDSSQYVSAVGFFSQQHKRYSTNMSPGCGQCAEQTFAYSWCADFLTHTSRLWMGVNISSRIHLTATAVRQRLKLKANSSFFTPARLCVCVCVCVFIQTSSINLNCSPFFI